MFIKVSLLYIELYIKNLKYNKISYYSTKPLSKSYEHETQYVLYKHKIQEKDPMTKRLEYIYIVSMGHPVNI